MQTIGFTNPPAKNGTPTKFKISTAKYSLPFYQWKNSFLCTILHSKRKKKQIQYAIIFSCLKTRAAHLVSCPDLKTETFLNALTRFTARRGNPKTMYKDNRKTFVGASNELKKYLKELNKNKIETNRAVKEFEWKFNALYEPHFCGAWGR